MQVKVGLRVFEVTHYAARVRRYTRCQKITKYRKQTTDMPTVRGEGSRERGCSAATQTSVHNTPEQEQAQTVTTQHTMVGTQTNDTTLACNDKFTAIVDIIKQILGKQEGSRMDTTNDSRDWERGLERSRVLEIKQKGRERDSQLKRTHITEYKEMKQSQQKCYHSLMSQNLKKELSAGQDYTSEDAADTDRS